MAAMGLQDSQNSSINFSLSLDKNNDSDEDLSQRIEDYKNQNPEDVEELKRCIHDVLGEAERTAQERLDKKAVSWSFLSIPKSLTSDTVFVYLIIRLCYLLKYKIYLLMTSPL